jgi:hypothetical protein
MLEEAIVLGRQHGIDHLAGNRLERQRDAALFAELGDQPAVAAEHAQWHLQPDVLDGADIGQAGPEVLISPGQAENRRSSHTEHPGDSQPEGRFKVTSHGNKKS